MSKLIATPEILGAFGAENEQAVMAQAQHVESSIITVKNSDNEVNLTLPYYSYLDTLGGNTTAASDEDLDEVAGGEVVLVLAIIAGGAAVIGGGSAVPAIVAHSAIQDSKHK